jgi:hypothetical protein
MHAMGFRIAWPFRFEGKSLVCPDAALLELFGATTTARKIPGLRGLGRVVQVSEGDVAGETCLPLLFGGKHAAGASTSARPQNSKTAARSTPALDFSFCRCCEISYESAAVQLTKNDSISTTYEFRTKSAQSGGLENNG